jgi:anti-anti-sigma factor
MLNLTVHNSQDGVTLSCVGKIVRGVETQLLCAASRQKGQNITIDMRHVEAIDAAGIGALVSLRAAGIYLKLANPNKQVREVLRITNLDTIFEFCESQTAETGTSYNPQEIDHSRAVTAVLG